jgi:hypothetical protein
MIITIVARNSEGQAYSLRLETNESWIPLNLEDIGKEFRLSRLATLGIDDKNGKFLYTCEGEISPI